MLPSLGLSLACLLLAEGSVVEFDDLQAGLHLEDPSESQSCHECVEGCSDHLAIASCLFVASNLFLSRS